MAEHNEKDDIGMTEAWVANMKRMFDDYHAISVNAHTQMRAYVDKVLADAAQHDNVRQSIANQSLQNAVTTADMVAKQAIRHADLAVDRQWNNDEVAELTAKNGVQADTVQAIVAAVMAQLAQNDA